MNGQKLVLQIKQIIKTNMRRRPPPNGTSRAEAKEGPPPLRQDKPPPVRRGCHWAPPFDSADLPFVPFLSLHAFPSPFLPFPLPVLSFPLLPSTVLSIPLPFLIHFVIFREPFWHRFFHIVSNCENLVFCNKHRTGTTVFHHFPSQSLT